MLTAITQGPRPVEEGPLETLPVAAPERKEVSEESHPDFYLLSPEVTHGISCPNSLARASHRALQRQGGRTCNPTMCREKRNKDHLFAIPRFCSLQFLDGSPCLADSNLFINQKNLFSSFSGAHPSSVQASRPLI